MDMSGILILQLSSKGFFLVLFNFIVSEAAQWLTLMGCQKLYMVLNQMIY